MCEPSDTSALVWASPNNGRASRLACGTGQHMAWNRTSQIGATPASSSSCRSHISTSSTRPSLITRLHAGRAAHMAALTPQAQGTLVSMRRGARRSQASHPAEGGAPAKAVRAGDAEPASPEQPHVRTERMAVAGWQHVIIHALLEAARRRRGGRSACCCRAVLCGAGWAAKQKYTGMRLTRLTPGMASRPRWPCTAQHLLAMSWQVGRATLNLDREVLAPTGNVLPHDGDEQLEHAAPADLREAVVSTKLQRQAHGRLAVETSAGKQTMKQKVAGWT